MSLCSGHLFDVGGFVILALIRYVVYAHGLDARYYRALPKAADNCNRGWTVHTTGPITLLRSVVTSRRPVLGDCKKSCRPLGLMSLYPRRFLSFGSVGPTLLERDLTYGPLFL